MMWAKIGNKKQTFFTKNNDFALSGMVKDV